MSEYSRKMVEVTTTNLHREQETAEVTCQFCDAVYTFSYEDMEDLLKNA